MNFLKLPEETEKMNNSLANFTTSKTPTHSTIQAMMEMDTLNFCVHCINFLVGLPTHSYIIWLIITGTGGVASAFFNLNLSVCEIGNCLISIFVVIVFYAEILSLVTFTKFLAGIGVTGRALFHNLICVERYLAVVHPVIFLKFKPLRYKVICCSVAWMLTFAACVVCMLIMELFYVFVCMYSVQFILFLSIQLFCLVAVLRALKQSGPGDRKKEEENQMKRRAFYLILITIVSMTFIYVPFTISGFCYILTKHFMNNLFSFGFICNVLAAFVQPVLHLHRRGKLSCFCSP